jgi:hypothetical protein
MHFELTQGLIWNEVNPAVRKRVAASNKIIHNKIGGHKQQPQTWASKLIELESDLTSV